MHRTNCISLSLSRGVFPAPPFHSLLCQGTFFLSSPSFSPATYASAPLFVEIALAFMFSTTAVALRQGGDGGGEATKMFASSFSSIRCTSCIFNIFRSELSTSEIMHNALFSFIYLYGNFLPLLLHALALRFIINRNRFPLRALSLHSILLLYCI